MTAVARCAPGWRLVLAAWLVLAGAPATAQTTVERTLGGTPVTLDVYAPAQAARGVVVLAHGFLRTRATMAGHAQALGAHGLLALAPDLPSKVDSRANGRALADLVAQIRAGAFGQPGLPIVLVGFSAGGLAGLLAAGAPGVVGYVALDPFDRPGGVGRAAARGLHTPVIVLRGEAAFCNAYGIADPWDAALPALRRAERLPGGSHCDFEAPSDRWCERVCGTVDRARQQRIQQELLRAVDELVGGAT